MSILHALWASQSHVCHKVKSINMIKIQIVIIFPTELLGEGTLGHCLALHNQFAVIKDEIPGDIVI